MSRKATAAIATTEQLLREGTARLLEDLLMSMAVQWLRRDRIKVIALAACAHVAMWMITVAISRWQWPHAPSAVHVVGQFTAAALICVSLVGGRHHSPGQRRTSLSS